MEIWILATCEGLEMKKLVGMLLFGFGVEKREIEVGKLLIF
jgi:hypothetical protein